jgi:DNA gyrase subunit B
MKELISQGHLYIAQPPLYRATKGKTKEWLYNDEGLNKFYAKLAFENVSVFSKDNTIKLKGEQIIELLESLRGYNQGLDLLEKAGLPRDIGEILIKKDYSIQVDFSKTDREIMLVVEKWFQEFDISYDTHYDTTNNEYYIELPENKKFDKRILENPILKKCYNLYPKVKQYIEGKSFYIMKNDREIGSDVSWDELSKILDKMPERSGVVIQRYKGLGEMTPEQLWETTMDPNTRTILKVDVEDVTKADEIFQMLMGGEVPPRKAFIQAHAKTANLDI